jgi:Domain of unknown function (DUF4350)
VIRLRGRVAPGVLWAGLAVAVVLAFVVIGLVLTAVAPAPSGPPLSSYATTARGLAAWAELLERDGHVVRQIQQPLSSARLPADGTLVVLGGGPELNAADARATARFLQRGGWLVDSAGAGAGGLRGHVIDLRDPGFLENRDLAQAGNAFRALTIAGPPSRPVFFDEVVHGYGPAAGLAALPERWWFAFVLLALAIAAFALSRAVRLGGSDPVPTAQAWPRTAYVQAMAETLVRTASRDDLVRRVEEAASAEALFRRSF